MIEEQDKDKSALYFNWFYRWMFRWLPAVLIAEPMECFVLGYGAIVGFQLLNAAFFGPTDPQLVRVLGHWGLAAWAATLFAGSVIAGFGLYYTSKRSALRVKDRRYETVGLSIMLAPILIYIIALPFRAGLDERFTLLSTILTEAILLLFGGFIAIRIVVISSSTFLVVANRLTRIRLMKEEFKNEEHK